MMKYRNFTLSIACLVLWQCTSTATDAPQETASEASDSASVVVADDQTAAETTPPEPEENYGNFTRDELETALLGEIGGMRGYMPQAAESYYHLGMETGDPGILGRALEFASAVGNARAMQEIANRWLEVEPNARNPHLVIGYQYIEQGQFIRAIPHLEQVLELGGDIDFALISARTFNLEDRQRNIIIERLTAIQSRYPEQTSLYLALAQLHDQSGKTESAQAQLDQARERFGDSPRILLIEAQILQNSDRNEEAESLLALGVERYPRHRLLRYSFAQLLVENSKLEAAAEQFDALMAARPGDVETLYSLALINLELERLTVAESQFRELIQARHRSDEAHYYLASILQDRGATDEALRHFGQINRQSNAWLSAQRQRLQLLVDEQRYQEASDTAGEIAEARPELAPVAANLQAQALISAQEYERAAVVLDQALAVAPENIDLLFTRARLNETLDDFPATEADLRAILSIQPDNAQALNHLGYSLTVRTDRYEEALTLIEQAITLMPDDPAIIDSLGWIQFKLGYLQDALVNLQRAYDAFPDPEVAAHLGEVLWSLGRQGEAMMIWQEGLDKDPDSEFIHDALERQEIELPL
ncbi:hypothetical protein GCM10011403_06740 [Pseudohongiella nitratireducens]|uniref:TPR domain protein n=1 Tax=Pseudohongiella nitratireducens TaxID=1768907 RepID=A0A917GNI2_9GAMM|nr:tetratricopeptide repeat protein [Pseudohongiella nitratireducens]GGG52204.1 hypothetical protein GCM10011403_06740 [Pseudohongiella nitratireducens]